MFSQLQEGERGFLEALLSARGEVPLRDVAKMFKMAGYELDRIKGSHHSFVPSAGRGPTITMPVHADKVKAVYVRRTIRVLFPDI
jgi:predicted RNA binding protein YcfA (HicA-like mRNA interferase family)